MIHVELAPGHARDVVLVHVRADHDALGVVIRSDVVGHDLCQIDVMSLGHLEDVVHRRSSLQLHVGLGDRSLLPSTCRGEQHDTGADDEPH